MSPSAAPYAVEIADSPRYEADKALCAEYAGAYHQSLELGAIGESAIMGGAQNAAGAAVNPLVPALGALGGGAASLLDGLDLLSTRQRSVFLKCINKKTDADHSALVLEPEN